MVISKHPTNTTWRGAANFSNTNSAKLVFIDNNVINKIIVSTNEKTTNNVFKVEGVCFEFNQV